MENHKEIEEAKATLKKHGYQVDNLWHIDDVKLKYDCTDKQAYRVLVSALTNEATMEQIWFAIDFHAGEEEELKEKQEE